MKTLLKNAKILTDSCSEIISGNIEIDNNIITYIGNRKVDEHSFDKVVECNQNLLMSGFIDCHTHSPMVIFKGVGEGLNLESWLFDCIFKYEEKLTLEDVYYATKLAILEYLKNGITTINDMYYFPEQTAKACYESGLRAFVQFDKDSLTDTENSFNSCKKYEPLVNGTFGCHSVYTAKEERFCNAIKLSKKYNRLISTHMSETLTEVGNCDKDNGVTPVKLLENYGVFDIPSLVYHATYLDKDDFKILKDYNVSVCTNPCSNLKLGSGIAPINSLLNNGVNVCLGTDGSSSNNRLDMFREMYLVGCLQKAELKNSYIITCEQAIKIATENGAKALNQNKIGSLKVGNFADIIMINLQGVNNATYVNIKSNLVYASGTEDVLMTMVDGKILYKDGNYFIDMPKEEIFEKVKLIEKRLNLE